MVWPAPPTAHGTVIETPAGTGGTADNAAGSANTGAGGGGGGGSVLAGGSGVVIVSEDAFPTPATAPGIWTMQDVYHYEVKEEWI